VSHGIVRVKRYQADPSIRVVLVDGEIDLSLRNALTEALERAEQLDGGVLVDLHRCLFIDSTGIAILINSLRRLIRMRGALAVLCPNPTPRRVFELTKTDETLNVVETEAEAVAAIDHGRATLSPGRPA
jgi:anti-sigma B factor antagonist